MARRTTTAPPVDDRPPLPDDRPKHQPIIIRDEDVDKDRPKPPGALFTTNRAGAGAPALAAKPERPAAKAKKAAAKKAPARKATAKKTSAEKATAKKPAAKKATAKRPTPAR